MKRQFVLFGIATALLLISTSGAAFANSTTAQWKILSLEQLPNGGWNYKTSHPAATTLDGAPALTFQFLADDGMQYTNYMLVNYNSNVEPLTGATITATVSVTCSSASCAFDWRGTSTGSPASVRIEIQDTTSGAYTPNDYWWYHGAVSLASASGTAVTITADTNVRASWSNICGQSATDTTVYTGTDCVGGTYPGVSPYDGFTNVLANAKIISFSFGGGSFFANGVAVIGSATFTATPFVVTTS